MITAPTLDYAAPSTMLTRLTFLHDEALVGVWLHSAELVGLWPTTTHCWCVAHHSALPLCDWVCGS